MKWSRRRVLMAGGAAAGLSAAGWAGNRARAAEPRHGDARRDDARPGAARRGDARRGDARHLTLHNIHTGERLETEYCRAGQYVPESLAAIQVLLRDFRNGETHVIDPALMDYIGDVAKHLGVDPVFEVISGYRSPQTNALLHERSSGVAVRSLHLEGRAIDVRLAGVDCAALAARALTLSCGGVGYYRASDFVHLDTGAFRTWKG